MRMRRSPSARSATIGVLVGAVLVLGAAGASAQTTVLGSVDEAGWQGVLGARPAVSTGQRYVVVLKLPSLASKVEAAGGEATEADMEKWTAAATSAQEQFLARMA